MARVFRWQQMLGEGVCGTIEELAKREKVNRGYMSRMLRLTLLAPAIIEAILDGRQPEEMRLEELLEGFSLEWERQRNHLPDRRCLGLAASRRPPVTSPGISVRPPA